MNTSANNNNIIISRRLHLSYASIENQVSPNIRWHQVMSKKKIAPTAIKYQHFKAGKMYNIGEAFDSISVYQHFAEINNYTPITIEKVENKDLTFKGIKTIGIFSRKRAPIGGYVSDDEEHQKRKNQPLKHYSRPYYTVLTESATVKNQKRTTDLALMRINNFSFIPTIFKYVI